MKNLYVGNLPYSATEPQLRTLFEAHGNVERVNIVTDKETGRPMPARPRKHASP